MGNRSYNKCMAFPSIYSYSPCDRRDCYSQVGGLNFHLQICRVTPSVSQHIQQFSQMVSLWYRGCLAYNYSKY